MIEDLSAVFDKFKDDHCRFHLVSEELHPRPDLCAFLLLDKLAPGRGDMVCGAECDEISLSVSGSELGKVAMEEDIITLIRCGVTYDKEGDYLKMFVA